MDGLSVSKELMKSKVHTDVLWKSPEALCVELEVWDPATHWNPMEGPR